MSFVNFKCIEDDRFAAMSIPAENISVIYQTADKNSIVFLKQTRSDVYGFETQETIKDLAKAMKGSGTLVETFDAVSGKDYDQVVIPLNNIASLNDVSSEFDEPTTRVFLKKTKGSLIGFDVQGQPADVAKQVKEAKFKLGPIV